MDKWNIQEKVKILVPIDKTQEAEKAASYATGIAKNYSGTLELIHVVPTPVMPKTVNEVPSFVSKMREKVESSGVKCNASIFRGYPGQTIVQQAEENDFDLIVMANRSLGGLGIFKLDDTSDYVTDESKIPVLVVK
jgi:nucleotide-binding universal stress UspA family protein